MIETYILKVCNFAEFQTIKTYLREKGHRTKQSSPDDQIKKDIGDNDFYFVLHAGAKKVEIVNEYYFGDGSEIALYGIYGCGTFFSRCDEELKRFFFDDIKVGNYFKIEGGESILFKYDTTTYLTIHNHYKTIEMYSKVYLDGIEVTPIAKEHVHFTVDNA